eukprot:TRINITY_DN1796_c0_g1_i3.p1 TRINITY_DN1796_c0_g1~~TRINITY_DN1796_c0_g1_i3.p1  ORF type:complete len:122 (-),score=26.20 TRINITY_DN1796_c0_g1_i3:74-439(-)
MLCLPRALRVVVVAALLSTAGAHRQLRLSSVSRTSSWPWEWLVGGTVRAAEPVRLTSELERPKESSAVSIDNSALSSASVQALEDVQVAQEGKSTEKGQGDSSGVITIPLNSELQSSAVRA